MKTNITIVVVLLLIVGSAAFYGCNLENLAENTGFQFDEKTFNAEWDTWKNKNILNYSFTMTGELPYWNFPRAVLMRKYEVTIIVTDGVMTSFEYAGEVPHKSDDADSPILEPEYTSISDMYAKISERAAREKEWWAQPADEKGGFVSTSFKLKYDPQSHYITFFEPDTRVKSGYILDTTEHAVTISNFTITEDSVTRGAAP